MQIDRESAIAARWAGRITMGPAGRDRRMRAESRQPGRVTDDESESERCDVEAESASSSARREPYTRSQQTSPPSESENGFLPVVAHL